MRVRKQIQLKGKPKYVVIVDGETEFWYMQMLKRNEKLIKVDIKPEIPQKKKLADLYLAVSVCTLYGYILALEMPVTIYSLFVKIFFFLIVTK